MSNKSDLREDKRKEAKSLFYRMIRADGLNEYSADRISKQASYFFQEQYAESVAQEPKQEHDRTLFSVWSKTPTTTVVKHDHESCMYCQDEFARAVAIGKSQAEHDHLDCGECAEYRREALGRGFETGKATLKSFDVDALAEVLEKCTINMLSFKPEQVARMIADNFAAPEETERCGTCDHNDGARQLDYTAYCAHTACMCTDPFHRERGTV